MNHTASFQQIVLFIGLFCTMACVESTAQDLQLKTPVRYLALGDSYTIGQSVPDNERWPIQLRDSLVQRGITVEETRVIATTGWRTDNLLSAITNQQLATKNYNLVSLLIGVNDQYQQRPIEQYEPHFRELLDSCLLYAGYDTSSVFVVSIPDYAYTPFGQRRPNPDAISEQLDAYNAINRSVCEEYELRYFDITPISRLGLSNSDLVAVDELHPSGYQYTLWVRSILTYLDQRDLTSLAAQSTLKDIKIYPVPARQRIRVEGLAADQYDTIRILNALGQVQGKTPLMQQDSLEISIDHLAKGTYFLQAFKGKLLVAKANFIVQ